VCVGGEGGFGGGAGWGRCGAAGRCTDGGRAAGARSLHSSALSPSDPTLRPSPPNQPSTPPQTTNNQTTTLARQESFLGKLVLHLTVFAILAIRSSSDLDKFKNLLDEATFYDRQWAASWDGVKRPSETQK